MSVGVSGHKAGEESGEAFIRQISDDQTSAVHQSHLLHHCKFRNLFNTPLLLIQQTSNKTESARYTWYVTQ